MPRATHPLAWLSSNAIEHCKKHGKGTAPAPIAQATRNAPKHFAGACETSQVGRLCEQRRHHDQLLARAARRLLHGLLCHRQLSFRGVQLAERIQQRCRPQRCRPGAEAGGGAAIVGRAWQRCRGACAAGDGSSSHARAWRQPSAAPLLLPVGGRGGGAGTGRGRLVALRAGHQLGDGCHSLQGGRAWRGRGRIDAEALLMLQRACAAGLFPRAVTHCID